MLFISCTSVNIRDYDTYWRDWRCLTYYREGLLVGDIIVVRCDSTVIGMSGHAAVILGEGTVGEYPKIGYRYWQGPSAWWLHKRGDMVVLRYRHFTPEFREKFLQNAEKLKDGWWGFTLSKRNDRVFYCSQYVWYLYSMSAKDLGYELDLDTNGGLIAFPYDFFGNEDLIPIAFEKELPEGLVFE